MAIEKFTKDEQRAAALLARHILAGLGMSDNDPADQEMLADILSQDPSLADEFEKISDYDELRSRLAQYRRLKARLPEANKRLQAIYAGETTTRKRIRVLVITWTSIAASLLILALVVFLARYRKEVSSPAPMAKVRDLPPGGQKALLTLADGRQIPLDSAHLGLIASQGNLKLVNQPDGQLIYQGGRPTEQVLAYNTVSTPAGGEYKLILPDGTKVWLDALSTLRYPTAFTGRTRDIDLSGQAYFEVAHNPHPLVITTGKTKIQDLATAFNVSAYSDDPAQTITLVEGKVKVDAGGQPRFLTPGEQAQIPSAEEDIRVRPKCNLDAVIAWKNGLFVFDHTNLRVGMREIARWYDVQLNISEGVDPGRMIQGNAPRNENLSVLIHVLNVSGIHCHLEQRTIYVNP